MESLKDEKDKGIQDDTRQGRDQRLSSEADNMPFASADDEQAGAADSEQRGDQVTPFESARIALTEQDEGPRKRRSDAFNGDLTPEEAALIHKPGTSTLGLAITSMAKQHSASSVVRPSENKLIKESGFSQLLRQKNLMTAKEFTGQQEEGGFSFFSSRQIQPLTVKISAFYGSITIEGGINEKISKRVFKLSELYQVIICNSEATQANSKRSSITNYLVTFLFRDKMTTPIEFQQVKVYCVQMCAFIDQVMETHSQSVRIEPMKHLFVIKQHYVNKPQFKPQVNSFASSNVQTSTMASSLATKVANRRSAQVTAPKVDIDQLRNKLTTTELVTSPWDVFAVNFDVVIRSDLTLHQSLVTRKLLVCQNPDNLVIELHLVDGKVMKELIQITKIFPEEKWKIEVKLKNGHHWQIDFSSLYQSYQFLQIVKLFQLRTTEGLQDANGKHIIAPSLDFLQEQLHKHDHPSNDQDLLNQDTYASLNQLVESQVPIEIYTVSWNMARDVQNPDFKLLFPEHKKYNLIVFGAQECPRGNKDNFIAAVEAYIGKDYVRIASEGMWEMFIVGFVKKKDIGQLMNVETNQISRGFMNMVGNKGGISLNFTFYDKIFSFINVHLESGTGGKAISRNEMMEKILKSISTRKNLEKVEPDAVSDFNWIFGDMNARFKSTYSDHIQKVGDSHQFIKRLCDLHEAVTKDAKYPGYTELPIKFMPTYKREPMNNAQYINKKEQCPSFTDRILFKNNAKQCEYTLNEYWSIDGVLGSDHRPVFSKMTIKVKTKNYLNSSTLLNPQKPIQARGELHFKSIKLTLNDDRLERLKKRLSFPIFFQLSFRADWCVANPLSFEKSIASGQRSEQKLKIWKRNQLPILYTPINSAQILSQQRMTIVIQICESNATSDLFAYASLDMNELENIGEDTFEKSFCNIPVIGFNTHLGTLDAILEFKIVNNKYKETDTDGCKLCTTALRTSYLPSDNFSPLQIEENDAEEEEKDEIAQGRHSDDDISVDSDYDDENNLNNAVELTMTRMGTEFEEVNDEEISENLPVANHHKSITAEDVDLKRISVQMPKLGKEKFKNKESSLGGIGLLLGEPRKQERKMSNSADLLRLSPRVVMAKAQEEPFGGATIGSETVELDNQFTAASLREEAGVAMLPKQEDADGQW